MATAAFKLPRSVSKLIKDVRGIIELLIANVLVYATPNPKASDLTTLVDNLEKSALAAAKGGTDKTFKMNLDKQILKSNMTGLLGYIQTASGGDAEKINLVATVKKKGSPKGKLPAPSDVRGVYSDKEGEIIFRWNGIPGRSTYAMQLNDTPGDSNKWVNAGFTGKTSFTADKLVSGKPYSFRVATVSAAGVSGWSDEATHKAS